MKLPYLESLGYYASCMTLFNLIYLLRMMQEEILCKYNINWDSCTFWFNFIPFLLSGILCLYGIITTIVICLKDDMVKEKNTQGRKIILKDVKDDTGTNFFSNFSLLVLTSLSLPVCSGCCGMLIYLIVITAIGLVYMDKNLIYLNPILSLMHYSLFCCRDENDKEYFILKRGESLQSGNMLRFQQSNSKKRIFRINNKERMGEEDDPRN